jgi:hypothetical protein
VSIHDIDESLMKLLETTENLGNAKGTLETITTIQTLLENLFVSYIQNQATLEANAIARAQKEITKHYGA